MWTFKSGPNPSVLHFWLPNVLRAATACTFSISQLPKVRWTWCASCILTWKYASRHSGDHFSTFELPKVVLNRYFLTLLTWKCASPTQRRALFRHLNFLNFQKWSDREVSLAFLLPNVLRAMVRNFSSLIWPAGSAPAALASLFLDPSEPQIIGKTESRLSYLFAHLHLLSSLIFSLLFFSTLTLPTSAFPTVRIVGSLTSKLLLVKMHDVGVPLFQETSTWPNHESQFLVILCFEQTQALVQKPVVDELFSIFPNDLRNMRI